MSTQYKDLLKIFGRMLRSELGDYLIAEENFIDSRHFFSVDYYV